MAIAQIKSKITNKYQPFDDPLARKRTLYLHDYQSYEQPFDLMDSILASRALVDVQNPRSIVYVNYKPDPDYVSYLKREGLLSPTTTILSRIEETFAERSQKGALLPIDQTHLLTYLHNNPEAFKKLFDEVVTKQIEFLDSYSYCETTATLAKKLGLSCYSYNPSVGDTKSAFRKIARELDLPTAPGYEDLTPSDVVQCASLSEKKLIVKPIQGSGGSQNFIYNPGDIMNLRSYLNKDLAKAYVVEEFIEALSIDGRKISLCPRGLIHPNGVLQIQAIGDQIFGADGISYFGHSFPSQYQTEHLRQAYDIFTRLADHLHSKHSYFGHLSIDTGINVKTSRVFAYEYNLRKGGGTYGKSIADKRVLQTTCANSFKSIYPDGIFYWDSTMQINPTAFKDLEENFRNRQLLFDSNTGEGITFYLPDLLPVNGKIKLNIIAGSAYRLAHLKQEVTVNV